VGLAEALATHASGAAVEGVRAAVAGLLAQAPTVASTTPLPAGTPEQGEL
jgi:hypothetical protein